MPLQLDAPTIYRTGAPSLGVPVLALPVPPSPEDLLTPLLAQVAEQHLRLAAVESALARLQRPWWRKLWEWLTGWHLMRTPPR